MIRAVFSGPTGILFMLPFYTPVEDGSYYALPSVCPSICPSVRPLTIRVRSITLLPFKIFS